MRLATILVDRRTRAARVEDDKYVVLDASDVGALLAQPDWHEVAAADGEHHAANAASLAPLVTAPGKFVCVGLNYRTHILEMGRDLPEYPTLFAKFADTLLGADDDIVLPPESDSVDWEAELAVVIGSTVRRADRAEAAAAIAGFTVFNDVTMRDWQFRTKEWLQGKNFEASSPLGPVLVTPDELPGGTSPALAICTDVDSERMQESNTGDLLFDPVALVQYISTTITLRPGDLIATGTPGGVGHARKPPVYLKDRSRVVATIEHIGSLDNTVRAEE